MRHYDLASKQQGSRGIRTRTEGDSNHGVGEVLNHIPVLPSSTLHHQAPPQRQQCISFWNINSSTSQRLTMCYVHAVRFENCRHAFSIIVRSIDRLPLPSSPLLTVGQLDCRDAEITNVQCRHSVCLHLRKHLAPWDCGCRSALPGRARQEVKDRAANHFNSRLDADIRAYDDWARQNGIFRPATRYETEKRMAYLFDRPRARASF